MTELALQTPVWSKSDHFTMSGKGYTPSNAAAFDLLVTGGCGKHPLDDLTPEELTRAGHPRRSTASLMAAMRRYLCLDGDQIPDGLTKPRYTNLRDHCLTCAENKAEVRRCAVIDCPLWPYRMGRNPHNPRRGQAVR